MSLLAGIWMGLAMVPATPDRLGARTPEEIRLSLDASSVGEANFFGIAGAERLPKMRIKTHIRGELRLVGATRTHYYVATFAPGEIDLEQDGSKEEQTTSRLRKELSTPFLVSFGKSGTVELCQFRANVSTLGKQVILSLVSYLQFDRTVAGRAVQDEPTTVGSYRFKYRLIKTEGRARVFAKTPVPAPRQSGRGTAIVPLDLLSGKLILTVDRNSTGYPVRGIEGEVDERTIWQGKQVSESKTKVGIVRLPPGKPFASAQEVQREYAALIVSKPAPIFYQPRAAEVENDIQRNELGQSSVSDVVALLQGLGNKPEGREDLTPIYLKVNALLYVHPESTTLLKPLFLASSPDSAVFQIVTRALGAVGNDNAQTILVEAITAKIDDNAWATRLLATLTRLKAPGEKTQAFVERLSLISDRPAVSHISVMALGAFARSLRTNAPKRSNAISQEILRRLEVAKSSEDQKVYLGAIGNIGSAETMRACMEFLKSPDATVRAEAASALRFVTLPVVDDLLIHIIESDPDAQTRAEAVYAVSFRPATKAILDALEASLSDPSRAVRAPALDVLGADAQTFPRVIPTIQKVAKADPDPDVRDQAEKILKRVTAGRG